MEHFVFARSLNLAFDLGHMIDPKPCGRMGHESILLLGSKLVASFRLINVVHLAQWASSSGDEGFCG